MFHGQEFDNRFVHELPGDPDSGLWPRSVLGALWSPVRATPVAAPRLLAWSREVASDLGLREEDISAPYFAEVFAGNLVFPGMEPYAANYGGHQFGHWAGQLGDGRALSLGELVGPDGRRNELQLKGAGPTPYSRRADGRAVLRSSVREFLCSEAMAHLGVPTTRALCLVGTGEAVIRDMLYDGNPRPEPGAIVCRVAPSFVRFGNFELPASRGDLSLLATLLDFTIRRDHPHLTASGEDPSADAVRAAFFAEVCERTAVMIAGWMRFGFVHGVMNTDNMSILGLTIDYGPYGWIDDFDPGWTPNTTDAQGRRYRFGNQPEIAWWNLGRLASALRPLFKEDEPLRAGLRRFVEVYTREERRSIAGKLGLLTVQDEDLPRMQALDEILLRGEIDMTIFFRALAEVDLGSPSVLPLGEAFYDDQKRKLVEEDLQRWLVDLGVRVRQDREDPAARADRMRSFNPKYVLRNYLAQQVIDQAEAGDPSGIAELLEVLRHPFEDQPGKERFAGRRPDWARNRAGCSMLSCSS